MTNEYLIKVLIQREVEWELDLNSGVFLAFINDIELQLKGSTQSRIILTIINMRNRWKKFMITEPQCPIWQKSPELKKLLKELLSQAQKQWFIPDRKKTEKRLVEQDERIRDELAKKLMD